MRHMLLVVAFIMSLGRDFFKLKYQLGFINILASIIVSWWEKFVQQ